MEARPGKAHLQARFLALEEPVFPWLWDCQPDFLLAVGGDHPQQLEAACSPLPRGAPKGSPTTWLLPVQGQQESVPSECAGQAGLRGARSPCPGEGTP